LTCLCHTEDANGCPSEEVFNHLTETGKRHLKKSFSAVFEIALARYLIVNFLNVKLSCDVQLIKLFANYTGSAF
jgi:hypothetical protein